MRTMVMKDSQGSYNDEEEIRGVHVSMGKVEAESNGRRGKQDPITMRILHREVQRYRADNEKFKKDQEEILQRLNLLQRQINKESGTKQENIDRDVTALKSHSKKDEHGNDRQSRSMRRHHNSPGKPIGRARESSWLGRNPSVFPIMRETSLQV
jgi:hypothetical protein